MYGLLSARGNAVVTAIPLIRAIGNVIRPFQFGKLNVLGWNVLNGRIRRFAKRQGIARIGNHTARDGHDNASGIALDGNGMIWTWKLDLLFFHVSVSFLLTLSRLDELSRRGLMGIHSRPFFCHAEEVEARRAPGGLRSPRGTTPRRPAAV